MPLPSSGAMTLGNINVELGIARATQRGLGQSTTRALYGVASGAIRLAADGYGKSNAVIYTLTTSMNEYGTISTANYSGQLPPNWNGNAYWAALNANPDIGETAFCQGYPTFSRDICVADWGGILSGVQANASWGSLTKVEFYSAANALVQTVLKSSFTSYTTTVLGPTQTCFRIPGVSASLYSGNSPIAGTKIKWYFSI